MNAHSAERVSPPIITLDARGVVPDACRATRSLRCAGYEGPIVFIAREPTSLLIRRALRSGGDRVFELPFVPAELDELMALCEAHLATTTRY